MSGPRCFLVWLMGEVVPWRLREHVPLQLASLLTETPMTDSPSSRICISRRLGLLAIAAAVLNAAVAVLGVAFFAAWLTIGGGVWRSEVSVVEGRVFKSDLYSLDRLILTVDSCGGNPRLSHREESDFEVWVKVVASSTPFRRSGGCEGQDSVEVHLREPLRDRVVIDLHAGQVVSVDVIYGVTDELSSTSTLGGR